MIYMIYTYDIKLFALDYLARVTVNLLEPLI